NHKAQSDPWYFRLQFLFFNLSISYPLIKSPLMVLITSTRNCLCFNTN
ncbi:unnamed protein product, partial [Brassica oleracea]